MADCIFCGILAGEAEGSFVYRDEVCAAFMDIRPVNPGHLLVVPNAHADDLAALPPETAAHLMVTAQRLSAAVRRTSARCEGVDLFLADGEAAGQEVFHVHLHVIPRFSDDGFGFRFPPGYGTPPSRSALDALAGEISAALDRT